MRLIQFGQYVLSELNAVDELGFEGVSGLRPLVHGAYDAFGHSMPLAPRTFTRELVIMASDTQSIREQLDDLYTEVAKGRRLLQAEMRDGTIVQTWAKVIGIQQERGVGTPGYQPLSLTFEVDYPYWLNRDDEPDYLEEGTTLDGTWQLVAGNVIYRALPSSIGLVDSFSINNTGQVAVPRGYVSLETNASGSYQNLKVHNTTNGHWFMVTGWILSNQIVELNILTQELLINGYAANDRLALGPFQQDAMILDPGTNLIEITADDTGLGTNDFYWQWSRHYIG